jgi:hypothetical protein
MFLPDLYCSNFIIPTNFEGLQNKHFYNEIKKSNIQRMFRKVEKTIIEDQNSDILIFGWAEIFFVYLKLEAR